MTAELATIVVKSTDPKSDAIVRLATLVGGDGERVKELVAALDPILLPVFLELGSIVFFGVAFPRRNRKQMRTVAVNSEATVTVAPGVYTREAALRDFRGMREVGAQRFLSERWRVDKSTVSRWLKDWETEGLVRRGREGKAKPALALPCPRKPLAGVPASVSVPALAVPRRT